MLDLNEWLIIVLAVSAAGAAAVARCRSLARFRDLLAERDRAYRQLLHSEQRYRGIVEDQTEFLCRHREDGTLTFVNEAFCRYFGKARGQLIDRPHTFNIHPEDRETVRLRLAAIGPENPAITLSHRILGCDGSIRWNRWSVRGFFDEAGQLVQYQRVGRDTTMYNAILERLRGSEERYELVLRGANDGIWDFDLAGNKAYYSDRLLDILGLERSSIDDNPHTLESYLHPDDRATVRDAIRRHLKHREPFTVEHRLRTGGGGFRWFVARGQALWNESGRAVRVAGSTSDIHERKMEEVRREQRAERYRRQQEALVQIAQIQIADGLDAGTFVRFFCEAAARGLDVPRATIWIRNRENTHLIRTGRYDAKPDPETPVTAIPVCDYPEYIDALCRERALGVADCRTDPRTARWAGSGALAPRTCSTLDAAILVSGQLAGVLVLEYAGAPRTWQRDELNSACALGDQAAKLYMGHRQLRTERALRTSEERFRTIAEQSIVGLYTITDEQVSYVNDAVVGITGYSRKALLDMVPGEFLALVHPDDRAKVLDRIECLQRRRALEPSAEFRLVRPTGEVRWVETHGRYLEGAANTRLSIVIDITARKEAERAAREREQQLIQADKMMSLGVLVSGVAHEINNPNSFIMLNAPILSDLWRRVEPILLEYREHRGDVTTGNLRLSTIQERVPQLLGAISDGAVRIKDIVAGLKDFARQDTGAMNEIVNLNEVVEAAIILTRNRINKMTRFFEVSLYEGLPPIRGNRQRVEQVVINLINNACEALTGPECPIAIRTAPVSESRIGFCVEDGGAGIPESEIRQVLDPFYTTKRASGGTGLGLSIVDGIVRDHGGRIHFHSTAGHGTTVTVEFHTIAPAALLEDVR